LEGGGGVVVGEKGLFKIKKKKIFRFKKILVVRTKKKGNKIVCF